MPKNTISCRKCNAKFNSMLDMHHICSNEETAPKWGKTIGRNTAKTREYKQALNNIWLEQAEEQRKKHKTRPVYKKNYRRP